MPRTLADTRTYGMLCWAAGSAPEAVAVLESCARNRHQLYLIRKKLTLKLRWPTGVDFCDETATSIVCDLKIWLGNVENRWRASPIAPSGTDGGACCRGAATPSPTTPSRSGVDSSIRPTTAPDPIPAASRASTRTRHDVTNMSVDTCDLFLHAIPRTTIGHNRYPLRYAV